MRGDGEDIWATLQEAAHHATTAHAGRPEGLLIRRLHPGSPHDLLAVHDSADETRSLRFTWPWSLGTTAPAPLTTHGITVTTRLPADPPAGEPPPSPSSPRTTTSTETAATRTTTTPHATATTPVATTTLTLVDPAALDVFTTLVADVAAAVAATTDTATALHAFGDRLEAWRALLAGTAEGLSADRRRGLVGELLTLRDIMAPTLGVEAAATAWTGPQAANQDFQTPACAVEVKTTTAQQPVGFTVANERELDGTGAGHLLLAHYALDERRGGDGASLTALVEEVTALAAGTSWRAASLLRDGLVRYGYLTTHADTYTEPRYSVRQRRLYMVTDDFPRIVEEDLRPGVGAVTYRVELAACAPHEVDTGHAARLLAGDPAGEATGAPGRGGSDRVTKAPPLEATGDG